MEKLKYPGNWSYQLAESNLQNLTIVRAHLTTEEESFAWVSTFGNLNHVSWILNRTYISNGTAKRCISHRRWLCQHNGHGKLPNSKRNTGCSMSIDIKIKIITRQTKETDTFLKLLPALQALIKIQGAHNHPIDTAESLRFLRASDKTKAPDIFMTDDSAAEKQALHAIFPSARQLLCHFHVCQAEWKWLMNNTKQEQRQSLIALFKEIVRAGSEEELSAATGKALNQSLEYPAYGTRLNYFLQRKNEWVLYYRLNDASSRSHNTNNYAEACIRILKDIVLQRKKAINPVDLVVILVNEFEACLKSRLRNLAFSRETKYIKLVTDGMSKDSVCRIDRFRFTMPSLSSSRIYSIDSYLGLCSCYAGQQGAFCKHQLFLHRSFNIPFPNLPLISPIEKHALAKLALGDECPQLSFFQNFGCTLDSLPPTTPTDSECDIPSTSTAVAVDEICVEDELMQVTDEEARLQFIKELREVRLEKSKIEQEKFEPIEIDLKLLALEKKELAMLNSFKTQEQYLAYKFNINRCATQRRCRSMIKVQPTSIARRRVGLSRGSQRQATGRPKKRPHNININIRNNEESAKRH